MNKKSKEKNFSNWDIDTQYWNLLARKMLETILSVKVWIIATIIILSTILLRENLINGQVWGTVNTSVISVVVALREGFKISRVRKIGEDDTTDYGDEDGDNENRYRRPSRRHPHMMV